MTRNGSLDLRQYASEEFIIYVLLKINPSVIVYLMNTQIIQCIRKYIQERYIGGGVIKVSDVSKYCECSDGIILKGLVKLEELGEVEIEKRYSCPNFHYMRKHEFPFCSECNEEYPEELINVYFYFKPLATVKV